MPIRRWYDFDDYCLFFGLTKKLLADRIELFQYFHLKLYNTRTLINIKS